MRRFGIAGAFAAAFCCAPLQAAQAQSSQQAAVSASVPWSQTGVTVQRGGRLKVTAQGVWSTSAPELGYTGPAGYAGKTSRTALLPSANIGALIGRIGANGKPFLIGANYDAAVSDAGPLFLSINDDAGAFADNQGRVAVSLAPTAPAARTASPSVRLNVPVAGMSTSGGVASAPTATATAPTTTIPGAATPNTRTPTTQTAPTRTPDTRVPETRTPETRTNSNSSASVSIDVGALLRGLANRKPSTTPPSTQPPSTQVAVATPPATTAPPSRTPPSTVPSTTRPPSTATPPTRTPPVTTTPSTRPSATPPVLTQRPATPIAPLPTPERSVAPPPQEVASVNPPPEPLAEPPVIVAEASPVTPPPAVAPPPLIPAEWVQPAAIGGGALLLFLLLFRPLMRGNKQGGAAPARASARIVSDGRADQSVSVKWKARA